MSKLFMAAPGRALACHSPSTDEGSSAGSDDAPAAKPVKAAVRRRRAKRAVVEAAPVEAPAPARSTHKRTNLVWVEAGHDTFKVDQLVTASPHDAEALRASGKARYAFEAEVMAAKADKVEVPHLDGI